MEGFRRAWTLKALWAIYLVGFFFTLHYTLSVYINSSFLKDAIGEAGIGLLYTISSIITIFSFTLVTKLLKKSGEYKTIVSMVTLNLAAIAGLIFFRNPFLISLSFIAAFIATTLVSFSFDILIENYSQTENTGSVRGAFLSIANIAWLISPVLTGIILGGSVNYSKIYIASFIFLFLALLLLKKNFKNFDDPVYKKVSVIKAVKSLISHKNTRMIFMAAFLMQFFFSWMVIYMPIYIHEHIGFNWEQIGIMFSIALLPYIILEAPLGYLADTRFGEKEMLTAGFIITALSTIALSFLNIPNFVLWCILLFLTRVGASMLEIMTETYFFKIVNEKDIDSLSLFRATRPIAYVIGPLLASVLLSFKSVDYGIMFFLLGLLMLYGMRYSLALKDTR